ncbi:TetR/AcrR family transcriptional regulator [Nocardioides aurantiacus]|uniref:TetR family transcriptional regulator n=1 Tax=Nocardioides aurantiacus TaxID=86796 RepID=A0A3N2CS14_9ACTN|nr:TetR/AcrR family transcriptional regulator [Nocardioides aurantiacus]ROR90331.1 TetR family transcriptional regulator [Nocardioides aurantiacus]
MATTETRAPARERLLDAAEELFYEHGIAATGVDAVLRRAGVAPATLYAHFPSKDHLVAAYLTRRLERWRTTWDTVLERCGDDPTARALSVLDALEEFQRSPGSARGCAFLAASVEVVDAAHPAHEVVAADTRLLHERLHAQAAATGAADAEALATELLLVYDGALAARARGSLAGDGRLPLDTARALARAAVERHTTIGVAPPSIDTIAPLT